MRCDLAASLLHEPPLLFLDEPTIGLDAVSKLAVREFIQRLNRERGVTVILTTHDMDDIEALCTRVIVIGGGRILSDGTLDDLRERVTRERWLILDLEEANLHLQFRRSRCRGAAPGWATGHPAFRSCAGLSGPTDQPPHGPLPDSRSLCAEPAHRGDHRATLRTTRAMRRLSRPDGGPISGALLQPIGRRPSPESRPQLFWGLIRMMIFLAFYASSNRPRPMSRADMVTYIWLGQAMLGLLPWNFDSDVRNMLKTGSVAYELVRPLDLYAHWYFLPRLCAAGSRRL